MPTRSLIVRQVDEDQIKAVLNFHKRHVGQHLWPRTFEDMKAFAEAGMLWVALEPRTGWRRFVARILTGMGDRVVGVCYVALGADPVDSNVERHEFGGIYVAEDCRGTGLASCLGRVALAALWWSDPPRGQLIAHVHQENQDPRGMLQRLGFVFNGRNETPPSNLAPKNMKRNQDGNVVGDVFEFPRSSLNGLADWLSSFSGIIEGKDGSASVSVAAVRCMTIDREVACMAFREMAQPSANSSRT